MDASRVVVVRTSGHRAASGAVTPDSLADMVRKGFALLTGEKSDRAALHAVFRSGDRVGIKVNTLGGKGLTTGPDVSLTLAAWLATHGLREEDLIVWDRTNRELREAGYKLSSGRGGPRVFGTDTEGVGYAPELVAHLSVGSLFSRIQTDLVTASVSLAVLKDHGLAGVTAGMKNYFGAIHNPNKYHDSGCDPFVAEVFDAPPVRTKHRISILDARVVQYHRGPSYHPRWAEPYGGVIFSRDSVAADSVGRAIIERLRAAKGLPSLAEEGREPAYLTTAEKMGLGRADPAGIEIIEETVP
jgi:uncharacterized protein (DUF362 family)